jgi:hypothetical protein
MQYTQPKRVSRTYKLSRITISELKRLSFDLDTNMTVIIEAAILKYSESVKSTGVGS